MLMKLTLKCSHAGFVLDEDEMRRTNAALLTNAVTNLLFYYFTNEAQCK